ncbi:hypothetical protein PsorP6_011084 [Peronosclerospora sorghi]|uniref:Uncharacterized protein n=1 Tax=Peronosclerospora sorghi TaxID=230839 RepID=A0ACC0VUB7_9STRA|nr:hypothetical protein PsorP6_011084 [Peronosclerospora sorghi]
MTVTVATGKHMNAITKRQDKNLSNTFLIPVQAVRRLLRWDKIGVKPIDERFRGWSLNSVGVTVLCNQIDVARDLFFRQNENGEAVTLNGKVVSKNGSMHES